MVHAVCPSRGAVHLSRHADDGSRYLPRIGAIDSLLDRVAMGVEDTGPGESCNS